MTACCKVSASLIHIKKIQFVFSLKVFIKRLGCIYPSNCSSLRTSLFFSVFITRYLGG